MSKLLIASAAVLVLALGVAGVQAHQANQGMSYEGRGHHEQGNWATGGWLPNMMGGGMMGSGMMMNPDMMLVMMDADGDASVSADEFQTLHARMFEYLDANGDGKIEAGEFGSTQPDRSGNANE